MTHRHSLVHLDESNVKVTLEEEATREAVTDLMRFVQKCCLEMEKETTKTFNDNFLVTAMLEKYMHREMATRDILTVPVRSRLEAVLRWKKIIWAKKLESVYSKMRFVD